MVAVPFLERHPTTVTWSPGLSVSFFHPSLYRAVALLVSPTQFSTLPFSFFTSNKICAWGLEHWNSVTVPLTVVIFSMSYTADPWCADNGSDKVRRLTPNSKTLMTVCLIRHLQKKSDVSPNTIISHWTEGPEFKYGLVLLWKGLTSISRFSPSLLAWPLARLGLSSRKRHPVRITWSSMATWCTSTRPAMPETAY